MDDTQQTTAEFTGHVRISSPPDFKGGRLTERDIVFEIDGVRQRRWVQLSVVAGVKQLPLVTFSFYPQTLDIDAAAMGWLRTDAGPRERQDITDREWNAWEWAECTASDRAEKLYVPVKPAGVADDA